MFDFPPSNLANNIFTNFEDITDDIKTSSVYMVLRTTRFNQKLATITNLVLQLVR